MITCVTLGIIIPVLNKNHAWLNLAGGMLVAIGMALGVYGQDKRLNIWSLLNPPEDGVCRKCVWVAKAGMVIAGLAFIGLATLGALIDDADTRKALGIILFLFVLLGLGGVARLINCRVRREPQTRPW